MITSRTCAPKSLVEASHALAPPEELIRFAEEVGAKQRSRRGAERRSEVRQAIAVKVFAQPVNADLTSTAEPFIAVSRDLSASGMAMFHTAPVDAKLLAVEFEDLTGDFCRMLMQVLRCRSVENYYEIAGRFVPWIVE